MKVPIKCGPGTCIFQPMSKIAFAVFIIIYLCLYHDVAIYGTAKPKSENTDFILSFCSSLTHGLKGSAPQIPS